MRCIDNDNGSYLRFIVSTQFRPKDPVVQQGLIARPCPKGIGLHIWKASFEQWSSEPDPTQSQCYIVISTFLGGSVNNVSSWAN